MRAQCRACGLELEIPSGASSTSCPRCRARVDVTALETRALSKALAGGEDPEALLGTVIGGHRLDSVIGRGGMGVVYAATRIEGDGPERVAVKVLAPELRDSEELVARFRREAEALTELRHPNLIEVYASGVHLHGGRPHPYFVMELFEGEDLRAWIARGPVEPALVSAIVRGAARGLAHAHAHGVVHRDVKPANLLVRGDPRQGGVVKVVDFGVAHIAAGEYTLTSLTSSALLIGTINYMAPEQRVDASVIDRRADVYALGVVAYELLTGKLPLGVFSPPSALIRSLPGKVDQAITAALRQEPDARIGEVELFAERLERALARRNLVPRIAVAASLGAALLLAGAVASGLWPTATTVEKPATETAAVLQVQDTAEVQDTAQVQDTAHVQPVEPVPDPDAPLRALARLMAETALDGVRATAPEPEPEPEPEPKPSKKSKLDAAPVDSVKKSPQKTKREKNLAPVLK